MDTEVRRQLVHLSGILFIILAQLVGATVSVYLFIVAATLFAYSLVVRGEQKRMSMLARLEMRLRSVVSRFERKDIKWPFSGAIWFFFSCGLAFLLFPLNIASAACLMLVVGDGLSTLVGTRFGRHRILGHKSLEGTAACFLGALSSMVFISPIAAVVGSAFAALAELVPDLPPLARWKRKGLLDDNLLIPIFAGAVLVLAGL
jgi:dolichol kinase